MAEDFALPGVLNSKGQPPKILTKFQYLAWKFCKQPDSFGNAWSREMGAARKLYKVVPDFEFWRQLYLPFKLNSLLWFLTGEGKVWLIQEKNKYFFDFEPAKSNNNITIARNNIEKPIKIIPPKTIFDFVKHDYGKKS